MICMVQLKSPWRGYVIENLLVSLSASHHHDSADCQSNLVCPFSSRKCFVKSKSNIVISCTMSERSRESSFTNFMALSGSKSNALIKAIFPRLSCAISSLRTTSSNLGLAKRAISRWFSAASTYPCILTMKDQSSSFNAWLGDLEMPSEVLTHSSNAPLGSNWRTYSPSASGISAVLAGVFSLFLPRCLVFSLAFLNFLARNGYNFLCQRGELFKRGRLGWLGLWHASELT
jgi:hypothetical protein